MSEFFALNTSDPPHWTLNLCFGAICTIWVHFGPFGCHTNLGGKLVKPVQKFVPRSRFGIFRNEHSRSSPFDSKLMFWRVSYHLGPFGCITKLGTKRAELGQKFVPRSRIGMVRNERTRSTHWTLNSCFGVFRCN